METVFPVTAVWRWKEVQLDKATKRSSAKACETSVVFKEKESKEMTFPSKAMDLSIVLAFKDDLDRMLQSDTLNDVPKDEGSVEDLDNQNQ